MVLLPATLGGDPLSWAVLALLGAMVWSLRKLIRTIAKIARLQLWAWFSQRHKGASKSVKKLIEQASQQDLQDRNRTWAHWLDRSK